MMGYSPKTTNRIKNGLINRYACLLRPTSCKKPFRPTVTPSRASVRLVSPARAYSAGRKSRPRRGPRRTCLLRERFRLGFRKALLDRHLVGEDGVHLCLEDGLDLGVLGRDPPRRGDRRGDLREQLVDLLVPEDGEGLVLHDVRGPSGHERRELAVVGVRLRALEACADELDEGHGQLLLVVRGLGGNGELGAAEVGGAHAARREGRAWPPRASCRTAACQG